MGAELQLHALQIYLTVLLLLLQNPCIQLLNVVHHTIEGPCQNVHFAAADIVRQAGKGVSGLHAPHMGENDVDGIGKVLAHVVAREGNDGEQQQGQHGAQKVEHKGRVAVEGR